MKKILALVLSAVILLSCVAAYAATPIGGSAGSSSSGTALHPFKFEHKKGGIGCGNCPVYSAPYTYAYRAANGKAVCDTNHDLDIGGYDANGWLLVRYTTNNGSTRVGWIPPKYVSGVSTSMYPHFGYVPRVAASATVVTDNNLNPYDSASQFAMLDAGETYYLLGYYNYYGINMEYIEFDLGGQPARGFILI